MSSCINDSGNGNNDSSQDSDPLLAYERYFDSGGKLLQPHYSFIYEKSMEAAKRYGKDLSWVLSDDPLDRRRAAAKAKGWCVAAGYCRCSMKDQNSYEGQMASCVDRAIANDSIIFPEMMAGDKAVSGKKDGRAGLGLVKSWVLAGMMTVLVAFSVTRLYRRLHKGLQFVREDVVERGVRILAVAENTDSADKQFSMVLNMNMMVAEMQASALPEFVRMGQKAHVENGFLVGACPLGYKPVAVLDAGTTKKGKAKTRAKVVPEVAAIINRAYERIDGGTTISEACKLYNRDVAELPEDVRPYAIDPRSSTGIMRPEAFRKMLSRERYTGTWRFGVLRNQWMDGRNTTVQVRAPEHEVVTYVNEELRIVSDELFHRVQRKLSEGKRGQHGPRTGREATLATSLTSMYRCSECGHVFHYYGMKYMHCPESTKGDCGNWGTVNREDALAAIITVLRARILDSGELVTEVVRQSRELDSALNEGNLAERIAVLEKAIRKQNALMLQIEQSCSEDGMDADDKARHKAAKSEKSRLQAELAVLKAQVSNKREPVSEGEVTAILKDFDSLLSDAAAGNLGSDGKQRAAALIRALVNGVVEVSFIRPQGRKGRAFGVGTFTPNPALALARSGSTSDSIVLDLPIVTVNFRELPRFARIADDAYRLRTEEGLSFTEIGKRLDCGSGNAFGAFAYWHTSRGLAVPYVRKRYKKPAS